MEFKEIQDRAVEIREKYSIFEEEIIGKSWERGDVVKGFIGDVSDLVKLTMAVDGLRVIDDSKEKLSHELADCLWSLLVIAKQYDVDIEKSFMKTMDELEEGIDKRLAES